MLSPVSGDGRASTHSIEGGAEGVVTAELPCGRAARAVRLQCRCVRGVGRVRRGVQLPLLECRAATGSAFLPWGEIEPEKLTVTEGTATLLLVGDPDGHHATRCETCLSLLYWTGYEGKVRVP